jgi:hypothetical protein
VARRHGPKTRAYKISPLLPFHRVIIFNIRFH